MRALPWAVLALFGFAQTALADGAPPADAFGWLQKTATAAHGLNYVGTFVYQRNNRTETSRITHLADESGEHEKLEVLDGPPREIIRNNDEVLCYLQDSKTVALNKLKTRKTFPVFLPSQYYGLSENYLIKLGERERVAGHECQVILLEPHDVFRYGHRICADTATGLPLKVAMLNEKNELVDRFVFTQITIGGQIDRNQFKPSATLKKVGNDAAQAEATPMDASWVITQAPPGFKKILEVKRRLPGKKTAVNHVVFSDELAAVSVFIEPQAATENPVQGLSNQGAINVYGKSVASHQITVLGEVPAITVMQIGNSVAYKGK